MARQALPSPNHDQRPPGVRPSLLIFHYTGMSSGSAAIARLRDPAAKVSAHYLIDEDGCVMELVPEERRAWHAGIAGWRALEDINSHSVGIELVNPGHEWGYRPFPGVQIAALIELAAAIRARHAMPPEAVLGHSDVAPGRKTDPGELFPWADLARHGLGVWPQVATSDPIDAATALDRLGAIGYRFDLPNTASVQVVAAFQRHWRPALVDGTLDAETAALIDAVARLYGRSEEPT
jgi:N-acetylmuramoyl-L-alanine amidase